MVDIFNLAEGNFDLLIDWCGILWTTKQAEICFEP